MVGFVCASCGDPLHADKPKVFKGKLRCGACYRELAQGVLPPPSCVTSHGTGGGGRRCGRGVSDNSPSQDNAIRGMEGD